MVFSTPSAGPGKRGAGELSQVVHIERDVGTFNARRERVSDWKRVGWTWARVLPLVGGAYREAQQTEGQATYEVLLRLTPLTRTLTDLDRLSWRGKTLHLETPLVDEAGGWIIVQAKTKTTPGGKQP